MYLLWCQVRDRSGDPSFIGLFKTEEEAEAVKELIEKASPSDSLNISFVKQLVQLTPTRIE